MAKTLKEKLVEIKRGKKKINSYRFLYNTSADLKRRYKRVMLFMLLYAEGYGYSIMEFELKRKQGKSLKQWNDYILSEGQEIFKNRVLPAMNAKSRHDWFFKDVICWKESNL